MNVDDLFDHEMARERKRTKTIQGKTFTFYCEDPYGFWTITCKDYGVEKPLPGHYTSLDAAEKAAIASLQQRSEKKVVSSGFKSDKKE